MSNRRYIQFFQTLHKSPVLLDCNFVVDSTNGNGLGLRSLKGPGIANVYMHTSATAAAGNPNPAAGYIYVQLQDNYNRYYGGFSGQVAPVSGTPINVTTGVTAGLVYVIVSVGTTSAAQWQKLGLPVGTAPAVGVSFVAIATTTATGSGVIEVPATAGSGIDHIEVIGDANLSIVSSGPSVLGQGSGAYLILACYKNGVLTAPTNGSAVGLSFYMGNSSILVQGE